MNMLSDKETSRLEIISKLFHIKSLNFHFKSSNYDERSESLEIFPSNEKKALNYIFSHSAKRNKKFLKRLPFSHLQQISKFCLQ